MKKKMAFIIVYVIGLIIFTTACSQENQEKQEDFLDVSGWIEERVSGKLQWKVNLTLKNNSKKEIFFGDDIILMEGQPEEMYDGVYTIYHPNAPDKRPGDWSFYGKAIAYGIANFKRYWPDGTRRGFLNGGTYSFADPPEYKPVESFCNSSLQPGSSVDYQSVFDQGTWMKPDFRTTVLLVLPEIKNSKDSLRSRVILTLNRSPGEKTRWVIKEKTIVAFDKSNLESIITNSKKNKAMRTLALKWLADVDKETATPYILQDIKQNEDELDRLTAIQMLALFNIEPDPEALNIVNNLAADTRTRSWSNDVAENYLNKQTGE